MRHKRTTGGRSAARISIHAARNRKRGIFRWMLSLLLCIMLLFFWGQADARIRPAAEKACLYECRSLTSRITAESAAQALQTVSEMDLTLTTASYDGNGNITGIQANADAVNTVQTILLETVNAALEEQRNAEFSIHLGTLTGSWLLSGRGAEIPLRYVPKGAAAVALYSTFSSAGINQTIHTLTAEITVNAACSVPLYQGESAMQFRYLLAETVIVGDTPSVNWNTGKLPAA